MSLRLNRKKLNPSQFVFTGEKRTDKVGVQLIKYDANTLVEDTNYDVTKWDTKNDDSSVKWLNLHGIHDVQIVLSICKKLQIDSLVVQDILDVDQRPKFQDYEDYWFFTMKSILPSSNLHVESEQLSFLLGKGYLISFQEKPSDHFTHVRHRLRNKLGLVREKGADFLLFLLLESILDNYYKTIAAIEEKVKNINIIDPESDLSPSILKDVSSFNRQVLQFKKSIAPIKELVNIIEREQYSLIDQNNIKYFLELKDLSLLLLDECEQLAMRIDSSVNLFFSVQGDRMNKVMKTLTIVATIFIPLTFIAGVYGMNFVNIPELQWQWGYGAVWAVMIAVSLAMLYYFKRKNWF